MRADPAGFHDFSMRKLWGYAALSLRSPRRRPVLFVLVCAATLSAAGLVLAVLPRHYEVRCRLVVRPSSALDSGVDDSSDSPASAAARLLRGEKTLRRLVRETDLVNEWRSRRPAVLRLKDSLLGRGAATDEEMLEALTALLERRLSVWSAQDGSVEIAVEWSDPVMAHRLVDAAQQRFVETWHALEVSSISEVLSILERHAAAARVSLERRIASMQRHHDRAVRAGDDGARRAWTDQAIPEASRAAAIEELEIQRRVLAHREQLRSSSGPRSEGDAGETVAPRAASLTLDVDERLRLQALGLGAPLGRGGLRDVFPDAASRSRPRAPTHLVPPLAPILLPDELSGAPAGPRLESARAELSAAAESYAALLDRIEAARLQLETSSAAFKDRYIMVLPPEVPRHPTRPTSALVMLAALVDALLLGLFATTAAELRARAALAGGSVRGART